MIEWMSLAEMRASRIAHGVVFDSFWHGRTEVDASAWFARAGEPHALEGLGPCVVWAGRVNALPFVIVAMLHWNGWGFEVRFPERSERAERVLAIEALGLPPPTGAPFEIA
jgi:hypothetical protein